MEAGLSHAGLSRHWREGWRYRGGPSRRGSVMSDGTSGDGSASPGGSAVPDPVPELLEEAECLRLIVPGGIGRLACSRPDGLVVLPVNYRLHEGTVVFRTGQYSPVGGDLRTGIAEAEYKVAIEVDSLASATGRGGSFSFRVPRIMWTRTPSAHRFWKRRRTVTSRYEGTLRSDYPHLDHRLAYRPDRESGKCVAQASPRWHGASRAAEVADGTSAGRSSAPRLGRERADSDTGLPAKSVLAAGERADQDGGEEFAAGQTSRAGSRAGWAAD
jgi:hypothetical protein